MSLHVVVKQNPYLKPGTWVECFDEGCQQAITMTYDNRVHVTGHKGILIPKRQLEQFMMTPLKRGLDK